MQCLLRAMFCVALVAIPVLAMAQESKTAVPELQPETPEAKTPQAPAITIEARPPAKAEATLEAKPETKSEATEGQGDRKADAKQAVRALLSTIEEGFNQADASALAACWTPSGDFIDSHGERVEGRARVEKAFHDSLAGRKNSTLHLHVLALRVVHDDLALVDTLADVKPPLRSVVGEPGFHLVLVKEHDRWLVESARETMVQVPEQRQHLKALEWLIGDWSDETAPQTSLSLRSTCGWTENRSFLIRRFKVEGKGGIVHAGTEVIGWDPRAKRIRSWVFDSNGGFGENAWLEDGNRWLMRYSGTLADGSEVAATNVLTVVDANTMTLESKDRTVNGQPQPAVPEITIKRQVKEAPKAE